jgi:hypothetical protein
MTAITITIAIAIVTATTVQMQIQIAQARRSIVGNYAAGYEAGKSAARQGVPTSSCPLDFGNNIAYCTGYHIGYTLVKNALRIAQP